AATEVCDGADNDCDTLIDDADDSLDLSTTTMGYVDGDSDGYGDPAQPVEACVLPADAVADNTDCDDGSGDINPGAAEAEGDRLDNDCDPTTLDNPNGGLFDLDDATLSIAGTPSVGAGNDLVVGDYNGDGVADVVLGSAAGQAFLHHGPITASTTVASADANLYAGDWPRTVMSSGDLDGDGYDDLALGAPMGEGAGFLQYGPFSGSVDLPSEADAMVFGRDSTTNMGKSIELLDDITGDGAMDWAITAAYDDAGNEKAGAIYIYSGSVSGTLALADADTAIYGTGRFQGYGGDAMAADVNGDGVMDFVSSDSFNLFSAGNLYVHLGPVSGSATTGDADAVYTADGDAFGTMVKSMGDVNNDGYADIGSAAIYDDFVGNNAGAVHVIAGEASPVGVDMVDAMATIRGEPNDYFGNGLQGVGDYNLDGSDDLAVGAYYGRVGGEVASAYVFLGPLSGTLGTDDAFIRIDGGTRREYLGAGIATTPDLDGDGRPELWMGAVGADNYNGRAFLFQSLDL
ncbi:MAG TPA: hypothetical protein DFR83_04190, partial [Deltaproteobacteria bacterium]|nr:hypothetical protein [Deltaproteobacteria bacterium]